MHLPYKALRNVTILVFALLLPLLPTSASTVIPPRDLGELARLSEALVLVRAGSAEPFARGRTLYTLTDFEVLRSVSGPLAAGDAVSVASLGGEMNGARSVVAGAPRFTSGETYLLFLSRDQHGLWRPRLLAYGLLKQTQDLDGRPLLKPLSEASDLGTARRPDGVLPEQVGTYRQEALLDHLGSVVRAELTWDARQVVASAEALFDEALPEISFSKSGQGAPQGCTYIGQKDEMLPFRWDLFDRGGSVEVFAQTGGDGTYAEEEVFDLIRSAVAEWQGIEGSSVDWTFGGGKEVPDEECNDGTAFSWPSQGEPNLIVFNDPCEEKPFPGFAGFKNDPRLLAYTDLTSSSRNPGHEVGEERWTTINSFRVITREGLAEDYSAGEYRQILLHELGHGLGFDHTSESNSVMYGFYGGGVMPIGDLGRSCARHAYDMQYAETSLLPVELAGFEVQVEESAAHLTWQTASETNNSGFEVQHALEDAAFAATGFVDGQGITTAPQHYAFTATDLLPGRHRFRLKQIDLDGAFEYGPEVEVVIGVPEAYVLSEAYPNPFNPRAQFTLAVAAAQHVHVAVYDVRGREVALLHDGMLEAGRAHRFTLEASGLPSGVYFYRATGETFHAAKPATLLK